MHALKFTRPGRIAPFTNVAWPPPGEWIDAQDAELCRSGIHGLLHEALPKWIAEELWTIELEDASEPAPGIVVGRRGRLLDRVAAWNDETARAFAQACAGRVREDWRGLAGERAAGVRASASTVVADYTATTIAYMAAHAAEAAAPGGYAAERAWQARWLVDRLGLAATA